MNRTNSYICGPTPKLAQKYHYWIPAAAMAPFVFFFSAGLNLRWPRYASTCIGALSLHKPIDIQEERRF